MGLPGCVGSIDCTHIGWHKCPAVWTNIMTGGSGKPTLSFQVVVDHNRKVTHCSKWFYGTWNDKMITTNVSIHFNCLFLTYISYQHPLQDTYPRDLMMGRAHRERTFRTYGANGVAADYKTWAGCWVLCDGGYQHVQASPPPLPPLYPY
jgi:hypothetical protein